MPHVDQDRRRDAAKERKRRWREREHLKKYGPDAGDMRGKGRHSKGPEHYRWSDKKILSSHGYVKVRVGEQHPLADPNGYAYEHLLVWIAAGRSAPAEGEILHHLNEVKTDNRIENLAIMRRGAHGRHHIDERERDDLGRLRPDGRTHDEFPEVQR